MLIFKTVITLNIPCFEIEKRFTLLNPLTRENLSPTLTSASNRILKVITILQDQADFYLVWGMKQYHHRYGWQHRLLATIQHEYITISD